MTVTYLLEMFADNINDETMARDWLTGLLNGLLTVTMTDTYLTLRDMPDDVRARLDGVCFTACENGRRREQKGGGKKFRSIRLYSLTYSTLVMKCC